MFFGGWLKQSTPEEPVVGEPFYFSRADVAKRLESELHRKNHILLYGLPRQGKTTLVRRALADREHVTLHASPDVGFADIFRNYLLTIGCSVAIEQRRKKRLGGKAEIKFKWPLIEAGAGVDGGAETEVTLRNFTADIGSPNDVCYLLGEIGRAPCLVLDRFEQLGKKQRGLVLDFLQIAADSDAIQVVLVASALDQPLDYRERIELSRCLSLIHLQPLTQDETNAFVPAALAKSGCPAPPELPGLLHEMFGGSLELTLDACSLYAARVRPKVAGAAESLETLLFDEIREQMRNYLLALLTAVIEEGWPIRYTKRLVQESPAVVGNPQPGNTVSASEGEDENEENDDSEDTDGEAIAIPPIDEALSSDPGFAELYVQLQEFASNPPFVPPDLKAVVNAAVQTGCQIVQLNSPSESVRPIAFSITALLRDPTAQFTTGYQAPQTTEEEEIPFGNLLCELLLSEDLNQPIVVTEQVIEDYFTSRGCALVRGKRSDSIIRKMARRVRKLQRNLRIDPPLLKVDADRTQITLWDPRNHSMFGDIKQDVRELLDSITE